MDRVAKFLVKHRVVIFCIMVIFTILCGTWIPKVNVNTDMTKYLADSSNMKQGIDIMAEQFPDLETTNSLRVMFTDLDEDEKERIAEELDEIRGVESVDYEKDSELYNKDKYTLYKVHHKFDYDSEYDLAIQDAINEKYKDKEFLMITDGSKAELSASVVIFAVVLLMIILFIMCKSWIEPLLFIIVIAMAIVINMGTNIFKPDVSSTTFSIAAILQMALSMDYSIILMNRYRQERERTPHRKQAMAVAISKAFASVTSSAFTTFIGLLVLVFMHYKLGADLGIVLAKGVFCSWMSVFLILPVVILTFDKVIANTAKKSPHVPMDKIAGFSYKFKKAMPVAFIMLFIVAFVLQQKTGFVYTTVGEDNISAIFPKDNQIVAIYNNKDADKVEAVVEKIEDEKKINSAMSYPTTLGKQVKVDELTDMVGDFSSDMDMEIDESLLSILYYDYFKGDELPKLTVSQLLNFISDDVMENETLSDQLDEDMKDQIDDIKKFADKFTLTKKMTVKELADFFDMKESDLKSLFVLYYSEKGGASTPSMTLKTFVNFIVDDVMDNKDYADMFNKSVKNQIKTLKNYVDKEKMTKKLTYTEAAKMLGIEADTVKLLYVYYKANDKDYTPSKVTLDEFVDFMLNNVAKDKTFSSYFDKETLAQVKMMATFTDKKTVTTKMNSENMSKLMGIDKTMLDAVYALYYGTAANGAEDKVSLPVFMNYLQYKVMTNPIFASNFDEATIASVTSMNQFITLAQSGQKLTAGQLAATFGMEEAQVSMLMMMSGVDSMTLPEFTNFMVNIVLANPGYASMIDPTVAAQLTQLNQMIQAVAVGAQFSSAEMSAMLGIDKSMVDLLYIYRAGINQSKKKMTPIELVDYLLAAKESGSPIGAALDDATVAQLQTVSNLMKITASDKKLSYTELSKMFGLDDSTMKLLFTLKDSYTEGSKWKLSMQTIVNYLVDNSKQLGGMLDKSMLESLKLAQKIINSTVKGTKYSSTEMAKLLDMDKKQLGQLYLLYTSMHGDTSKWGTSIQKLVDFLVGTVLKDKSYADMFDADMEDTLKSAKTVIDAVLKGKKYSAKESCDLLKDFTDDIDESTVELLYLYYASVKNYDDKWTMSIESLFNHLADDVVEDERFDAFISEDAKKEIKELKSTLQDGIDSLVGEDYSILMLSTSFQDESTETNDFIGKLKKVCNTEFKNDSYLVGNSVMNYEMKQTFRDEILLMTLLTVISIFIIVALTFKSVVIPTLLVAIVQCAVYVTVASSGLRGDPLHFIAYLMVQCILMGATIDYAILFTNYYKEHRAKELGVRDAIKEAYSGSIHTIFTSGTIIVAVTGIIGAFVHDIVGETCKTLSTGSFVAILLILFVLPGTIAVFDKAVLRRERKKREREAAKQAKLNEN